MGLLLAFSGVLPAVFCMWLVERYDARRPEPRSQLRKVALLGGLATIPCIAAQYFLDQFSPEGVPGALYTSFVSAALTEETAKAVALYLVVWRHPAFDERVDGIMYATRAGLGFALVENVGYLLKEDSLGGLAVVWVMRAILAVPGHAVYAGFMGYWAARRKFDRVGPGLLGGLLIAIALHGSYDASIFLVEEVRQSTPILVLPLVLSTMFIVALSAWRLRAHVHEALRLDLIQFPDRHRLPAGLGFVLR